MAFFEVVSKSSDLDALNSSEEVEYSRESIQEDDDYCVTKIDYNFEIVENWVDDFDLEPDDGNLRI